MLGIIFSCEGQNSTGSYWQQCVYLPEVAIDVECVVQKSCSLPGGQNPWKIPVTVYIF